jgi:hypothetical protein
MTYVLPRDLELADLPPPGSCRPAGRRTCICSWGHGLGGRGEGWWRQQGEETSPAWSLVLMWDIWRVVNWTTGPDSWATSQAASTAFIAGTWLFNKDKPLSSTLFFSHVTLRVISFFWKCVQIVGDCNFFLSSSFFVNFVIWGELTTGSSHDMLWRQRRHAVLRVTERFVCVLLTSNSWTVHSRWPLDITRLSRTLWRYKINNLAFQEFHSSTAFCQGFLCMLLRCTSLWSKSWSVQEYKDVHCSRMCCYIQSTCCFISVLTTSQLWKAADKMCWRCHMSCKTQHRDHRL